MSDVTGFAKMNPLRKDGTFRDELNGLMAANPKKDVTPMAEAFKKDLREYIKDHGRHMEGCLIEFEISLGKIYPHRHASPPAPICSVDDLPAIKDIFSKEYVTMEWAYDRGKLNGKLIFRW